jgi:hypothetical protein
MNTIFAISEFIVSKLDKGARSIMPAIVLLALWFVTMTGVAGFLWFSSLPFRLFFG